MILFSFASFIVPSGLWNQPTMTVPTPVMETAIPTLPQAIDLSPSFPACLDCSVTDLSLEKGEFLSTLSGLASMDPPNAFQSLHSLFADPLYPGLPAQMAVLPGTPGMPTILLDPMIKVIPWMKTDDQTDWTDLKLTLLASMPLGSNLKRPMGVLRLDVGVLAAKYVSVQ